MNWSLSSWSRLRKILNRVAYIDGDQAGQKAENLTPDEVSKREGINAEQIVIKITDQGYVTLIGRSLSLL